MQAQAQAMINAGVGVLLITDLDPGSGKAIQDLAKQHNVVTIDYDRLTVRRQRVLLRLVRQHQGRRGPGHRSDPVPAGAGQDGGQLRRDRRRADRQQRDAVRAGLQLGPVEAAPGWTKLDDQTGNWDAATAQTVFTTMLGQHKDINAVMVANDTMAQSVINVLQSQDLSGKVAVSGQDATRRWSGQHHATARSASRSTSRSPARPTSPIKLASQILDGQKPTAPATIKDPTTSRAVPSYLATPTVITKANVALPVTDGYVTSAAVCSTPALVTLCARERHQAG